MVFDFETGVGFGVGTGFGVGVGFGTGATAAGFAGASPAGVSIFGASEATGVLIFSAGLVAPLVFAFGFGVALVSEALVGGLLVVVFAWPGRGVDFGFTGAGVAGGGVTS